MPVLVRRLGDGPLLPTFLNEKALELFEADSLEDLLASYGGDLLNAIHPDDVELLREKDLRIASMEVESAFYEVRIVTKGGRQRLVRVLSKGMRDEDGDMELVNVALWLDACADAGAEEDIDPVTGLISMRTFLDVMERTKEDEGLEGDGSGLAVLYVGVVDFRTASLVNGAETSGALLRSLGDLLRMTFDAIAVSRADTSHLAVLLHSDNLEAKANVVNARVQELMPTGIGVSLGACVWGDRRLSPDDVCERARAACDVNRMHANTYFSLYSAETGRALDDAEYVVANIDEAIRNHWITVCYQPVIRSVSGHLCGMEALSRWEDPKRGMLSPAAFIGPLEDARLIWKLDLHVVRQVVLLISDRNRNGLEEIPISVNLSQIDFLCCDMFAEIEALVREHDVPRRALHIEVTESAFASRQDVVVRTLDRFRAAGYEVWMDDFGSGYSSLHLLDDYHVDVIKLDMAFLREETERSRKIISSIVAMGKRIGVRVLAEGVETEEQARFLRTIGCAKVQGNHFGVPRPFEKSLGACLDHGHPVENAKEKEFLDEVAEIDMITDVAQMVFDYCSRTFHIMLCNGPALRMSRRYGAADAKHFENAVNEWNRLSGYDLDKAVSYAIQTGKVGEQAIRFFGKEMVFRFRCRGQVDGHCLIVAQYFDYDKRAMKLADLTRTMTSVLEFYRNVFLVDLRGKTVRSLRFGNYVTDDDELDGEMIRGDGSELPSLYPSVIETEQDAYREFVDASTMRTRLLRTRGRALRRMFRTLDEEGERFVWMEHALSFVRDSDTEQVLYGIRPLDVGTLPKELADVRNESSLTLSEDGEPVGNVLWSSLIAHVSLKLFWKDKDRRFLGANKAFLEYYGFDSASEIIGRTDDELDWHPDESPYREDELEVLRSGTTSRDVVGRCIARGEARSIVSTKWPVYRDGRVAGLMGYFDEREPGASVAGDAAADHGAAAGQAAPASAPAWATASRSSRTSSPTSPTTGTTSAGSARYSSGCPRCRGSLASTARTWRRSRPPPARRQ